MEEERYSTFFRFIFGEGEGYICISRRNFRQENWTENYFLFPSQLESLIEYVAASAPNHDVYFCSQFLTQPKLIKDNIKSCPVAWADLDSCVPTHLLVKPSITIESSPNRYQAYWRFEKEVSPTVGEDVSRRIAYGHLEHGADISGWDLTQRLRVPFTNNFKYGASPIDAPQVKVLSTHKEPYQFEDFNVYPEVEQFKHLNVPFPEVLPDYEDVLTKHRFNIPPMALPLIMREPKHGDSWYKSLWLLERMLFEADLSAEEVFVIAQNSACNKYDRDNRPKEDLWKEVCRAKQADRDEATSTVIPNAIEALLTIEERKTVEANPTLIEKYIKWASSLGDASKQYHQAGAFTILSSVLASHIRLPTSFGNMKMNLWFLILGNTTLTRKTTAMDIAMDLLDEIDQDAVLATDGSIEGLFTGMSLRSGRSSIFLRDEFSGLLDAMMKKDYLAGMAETLTKLYDGKSQKRLLRKETIEVRDPILSLFTGGIKYRIFDLLTYEHVLSGFLPRFIFITAEVDITKFKPLGPPTRFTDDARVKLLSDFVALKNFYSAPVRSVIDGKEIFTPKSWEATLTDEAWQTYNKFEALLIKSAYDTPIRDIMMAMMDRLAKSGLKVATLIAASRKRPNLVVEEADIIHAFYYVEKWRDYALEVLENIGRSDYEKRINKIENLVRSNGKEGVSRSTVMQQLKLSSREAEESFSTLEQRGRISRTKQGRGEKLILIGA